MARPNRALAALIAFQGLVLTAAQKVTCKDADLASLARSWCLLEERRRILRGVPLPGQLRPDLDPVQMARMLKRARARQPMDIGNAGRMLISEGPDLDDEGQPEATPTTDAQAIRDAKESLSKAQG